MPKAKICIRCGRKIKFFDNRDYCIPCGEIVRKLLEIKNKEELPAIPIFKKEEPKPEEILIVTKKEEEKKPETIFTPMSSPKSEVLFIVDAFGWAYENIARGIQKYSKYKIDIMSWDDLKMGCGNGVDPTFLNHYGVVIDMVHACSIRAENWKRILNDSNRKFKFVIANWGHEFFPIGQLRTSDAFIIGDQRICKKFESLKLAKVYFIPEGIDTEFYKPAKRPKDRFVVGWAGNPRRGNKRVYLLKRLKYPVKTMSNWGSQFFVKNRDQTEMIDFYNSLDVYVYVSDLEGGQSTTILEAMASGLPVVSTDSGSEMGKLINGEWLLPINPEEEVIRLMNEKLDKLRDNRKLRLEVGNENRRIIEKYSWKSIVRKFDSVISEILGKPKVSVLITNYNYEIYLREAIDSALNQTYPNIEVVVVDDASTDRSVEILREYERRGKIKLIVSDKNYGYQHTINMAIAKSSGDYLMNLDSDDVLVPECVEALMKEIKAYNCKAVYPQLIYVFETVKHVIDYVREPFDIEKLGLYRNHNCANMMLFSRDCLKFMRISPNQWRDERYKSQGDLEWILRFTRFEQLIHVKKPLYMRRKHRYASWFDPKKEETFNMLIRKYRSDENYG
jgi:glycosyltransferase involved in cell wall biosynthesis